MAAPAGAAGGGGGGESMRPYMRMQNLFVRDIDTSLPRDAVLAELSKHCPPPGGKVVVPTSDTTGGVLGIAYLNYSSPADAARVIERCRFSMTVGGSPVRVTHAVEPRWRDHVFGPFGLRFQVLIKNLSPEVDDAALYERFARHGEVYQARVDTDDYGRTGGLVHYLDEPSVAKAVAAESGQLFRNTRILVEPHSRSHGGGGPQAPPPSTKTLSHFPSLPGARAPPAAAAAPPQQQPPATARQLPPGYSPRAQPSAPPVLVPLPAPAPVPPPPPPQQQQQQRPEQQQPGLPPHLSLMLDRQTQAFGAPPPPQQQQPHQQHRQQQQQQEQQQQQQQEQAAAALPFDRLSGLGGLDISDSRDDVLAYPSGGTNGFAHGGARRAGGLSGGGLGGGAGGGGARSLARRLLGRLDTVGDLLCCPITQEPFRDPVVASDGQTYERAAILSWMATSETSPLTNQPLVRGALVPNKLIRAIVDELDAA